MKKILAVICAGLLLAGCAGGHGFSFNNMFGGGSLEQERETFLSQLYTARIHVALHDREKAEEALANAKNIVDETVLFPETDLAPYASLVFTHRGQVTPIYIAMGEGRARYAGTLEALQELAHQGITPDKFEIKQFDASPSAAAIRKELKAAMKAVEKKDVDKPEYAFAEADRRIATIYRVLQPRPYNGVENKRLMKYYLQATQVFLSAKQYTVARDALSHAKKAFTAFKKEYRATPVDGDYVAEVQDYMDELDGILRRKDPTLIQKVKKELKDLWVEG